MKKLMLAAALTMTLTGHAIADAETFTDAQKAQIGEVAAGYLRAHPGLLIEMSQQLQAQRTAQMQQRAAADKTVLNALLNDRASPVLHPAGKVAVVQFFDYQCKFCAQMAPVTEQFIRENPDVRYVYKEFPIFGDASLAAARTGLTVWQQGGAEAYHRYHKALYDGWDGEGKLSDADIRSAAAAAGVKAVQDAAVPAEADNQAALDRNAALAKSLGIGGTPAFVILPVTGARADNVTIIGQATSLKTLQAAVEKARGSLKTGG